MALELDHVRALTAPFPLDAHEWRQGRNNKDYVYISESAVVSRLNEVDPSWSLVVTDRTERQYEAQRKNTKTGEIYTLASHELAITVALTIKGVTRYGIGMAEIAPDAAEADKSAVTDALKRAARLFGVGAYLLNDPPQKDRFAVWLAKLTGTPEPVRKSEPPAPAHGWTTQQYDDLLLIAEREGVDKRDLPGLLGVARVSEYTPGFDKAAELVKSRGLALKANGAK